MDEKRALFNQQMNEWVSRQGIWFQLRHAADGQSVFSRVARFGLKFLLLCFVGALVFWVYLAKRVEREGFKDDVRVGVEQSLKGKDCKVGAIRKDRGAATISLIAMEGTEDSFFHQLNARLIRLNMDLTTGLFGVWKGGDISINQLDVYLKAGASDDAEAAASYQSIFAKHEAFEFDRIDVQHAHFSWGYSASNQGYIRDSHMMVSPDGDGWRLEFEGGTFAQNWLRHLEIVKLVVICNKQGVRVQEGVLRAGGGRISFQFEMGEGGQPQVSGNVVLDSVPLKLLLPDQYNDWIEGKISGKGTFAGSPNSQEGIVFDLNLSLLDGDEIVMRDSLHLLSALSVVDVYNSYRKILFTQGTCHVRTGGGRFQMDQIDFKDSDLLHLAGSVSVRPPTHLEIANALGILNVAKMTNVIEKNWRVEADILESKGSAGNIFGKDALAISIFNEKNVGRFGGAIRIGLKKDAFETSADLQQAYPFDEATGRIWLNVPLSGRLKNLTLKQAKNLYILGRSRR